MFISLAELTVGEVRRLGGHGLLEKVDQFRLVDAVDDLLRDRARRT